MRQPAKVWTDPGFEQESLERLRQEFKRQNLTGTRKLSPFSVRKYDQTLEDFIRSLARHGIEPVLGELTVDNVALWQRDQQERRNSPHSISGRVIALKVFSNKFVFKTLALTTADLLRKVQRPTPKLEEPEILSPEETLSLVESFDLDTFEHIRDRGFVAVLAATGLRFNAVRTMHVGDYDRVTGEFKVHEKGDEDRPAVIDGRARRYLNLYLARRPRKTDAEQLWVTETGEPLSYWGAQKSFAGPGSSAVSSACIRTCSVTGSPIGRLTRERIRARSSCCWGTRAQPWPRGTRAPRRSGKARA